MTEIQVALFAGGLLALRIVSVYFVMYVITRQLRLWQKVYKQNIRERARLFRSLLFVLAVVMLLKNVIPIVIDLTAIALIGEEILSFHDTGETLIINYFSSNAILDLITSAVIYLLYREARNYQ